VTKTVIPECRPQATRNPKPQAWDYGFRPSAFGLGRNDGSFFTLYRGSDYAQQIRLERAAVVRGRTERKR